MSQSITIRAGDTEPLTLTLSATGLANLTGASTVSLYARENSSLTNHVDGASCTIPDSTQLDVTFDPAGAKNGGGDAFDAAGVYDVYLLVNWSDSDQTRHPGSSFITVTVLENFE